MLPLALMALSACQSKEQKQADAIKATVIQDLKDPSSAQFRNLKVHFGTMCGEVNGKNSYGAYTGFDRFSAGVGVVQFESSLQRLGKGSETLLKLFNESYRDCQADGKPVT